MKLVFDIGYNKGDFSNAVSNTYKECKIVAVEANPDLCASSNSNHHILNYLASNREGESKEFYINLQDGISTASYEWMKYSRFATGNKYIGLTGGWSNLPIHVKTITIDTLIKIYGEPDFIKIDVEGYELEVLKGLTKKVNTICFEFTEELLFNGIESINHLEKIGYLEFGLIGYFEEGDIFESMTYNDQGDPYLNMPDNFMSAEKILESIKVFKPNRKINYGMMYAR